jgi:spore maturation protein CgeB
MDSPRILYVGPLWNGGTCLQRMNALKDLGCRVLPFDTTPYLQAGSRIRRSLSHRFAWGPSIGQLNRDLDGSSAGTRCDWVWIDKGTWIYPQTVANLRRATRALMVHYTPDPAILFHRTRHFLRSIPVYDVLITSKGWEIEHYRKHRAKSVLLLPQGYDRSLFFSHEIPAHERHVLRSKVCFIGHCETHYYRRLKAAASVVKDSGLAVWGAWGRSILLHPWLRRVVRGNGIWDVQYAKALCCAEIALGLLSKWVPETSTTRTFEIPACGTFLLAERTEEHRAFFEEGKEAEFFDSDDEMNDKMEFYLAHSTERERIAAAGRQRCLTSGYSYHDRMRQVLHALAPVKSDRAFSLSCR